MQIPLTHDSACVGGHLLFACTDGRLISAKRSEGHLLVHDGDAVHGVTTLVAGLRYGLFALKARAANPFIEETRDEQLKVN